MQGTLIVESRSLKFHSLWVALQLRLNYEIMKKLPLHNLLDHRIFWWIISGSAAGTGYPKYPRHHPVQRLDIIFWI